MYHIYQTEGFILGSVPVKEANRYISIYTKELGLLRGMAQGVRNLRSKLKYSLQDLSYSKISLVRGKEVWRIVNAEKLSFLDKSLQDEKRKVILARIAAFLKRFVRGEERDERLFEEIKNSLYFVEKEEFNNEEIRFFDIVLVLRLLNILGYGPKEKVFDELIYFQEWDKGKLSLVAGNEDKIITFINKAIEQSHL